MPVRKPSFYNAGAQRQYMSDVLRTRSRGRKFDARGAGGYQRARRAGAFLGGSALRAIVTPETKYFDTGINAVITAAGTDWANTEVPCDNYVNSSGTAAAYTDSALIPSAVGSGYGQVNGNRYKLKALRLRGAVSVTGVTAQANLAGEAPLVRLVLVQDTQPNGAQAQGEDIFQDIGAAQENLFSFMRVSQISGRFKIVADKTIIIHKEAAVNNASAGTVSWTFGSVPFSMKYSPKVPLQVNITSANSTPAVAGLVTCNLFLLAYCASFTGVAAVNIQAASRAYYCD